MPRPALHERVRPPLRSRLFDEEDGLFRTLLLLFTPMLVGGAVATRAYALPPALDLDRATRIMAALPERIVLPPLVPIAVVVERMSESAPHPPERETRRPGPPPGASEGRERARVITTLGDALRSALGPSLDEAEVAALAQVSADHVASAAAAGLRHASTGRDDSPFAVGLRDGEGGSSRLDDTPIPPPSIGPRRFTGSGGPSAGSTPASERILAALRHNRGRIATCVEQAVKVDPALSGRISLGWTVAEGEGRSVHVVDNATGSAELAGCMSRALAAIEFGSEVSGKVDGFTWVVAGE